jgi:4-amino-4-deoxy-L-arabinose transferase-like glycosyltransferase
MKMQKMIKIIKSEYLWICLIIILAFSVRFYKIDSPVADWHSWRQADTAAVSRNFFKEGYNPLLPKYDDMSGVAEHPLPNPERYRMVEFPIYNSLVYFAYLLNGGVDVALARLVNIIFSLGSLVFVYLITKKYFGFFTALVSAFLFAVLPFNIFFSRVILPEPSLVFFSLGMFYFTDRWIREGGQGPHFVSGKNNLKLYFLSVFFTAAAFLTKPMAIFYLLPLFYSYYQKEGKFWPIPARYALWFIPSILPFLAWRFWISQYPEGIPASNWLLNGNGIRFKPAFFRWIIGDRLGREILGAAGIILFSIGLLIRPAIKEGILMHLLALSSFLFLIVFATGNVQHDYYQTLIVPALVIFTARGFVLLLKGVQGLAPRIWTIPLALLFLFLTIYVPWVGLKGDDGVKSLYQINNGVIVDAGEAADKILPKDAVVLAPYQGDKSFLYHINRPGWPVSGYPVDDLKNMFGVTHYVSVNYDAKTNWAMRKFTVIEKNPKFVIIDLTREQGDFYQKYLTEEEKKEP